MGEVREGGEVLLGVQQHGFDLGELAAEHVGDGVQLGADGGGGGPVEMVRMVAATISSAPFSITEKTLRTM
ncbi:hypothetical protein ACFYWN_37040 [Streptomyces sp. NPDC002917]|uniref:hypothetical protein n=1 Tax=unclassified Streptomyces TaxID=2593676 RepID=UPI0036C76942